MKPRGDSLECPFAAHLVLGGVQPTQVERRIARSIWHRSGAGVRQCLIGDCEMDLSCLRRVGGVSFGQFGSPSLLTKESRMKRIRIIGVCVALIGSAVLAMGVHSQDKKESAAPPKIMHFGDLKWTPIIKGCDLATVAGDPGVEGTPFVVRLRCVDGAKIPAHWHPTDENVTVLKGTFLAGMGETFDETKMITMNVGNFVTMPKEMRSEERRVGKECRSRRAPDDVKKTIKVRNI